MTAIYILGNPKSGKFTCLSPAGLVERSFPELVEWSFPDPANWETVGVRELRDAVDDMVRGLAARLTG